jgi:hypothetical protein
MYHCYENTGTNGSSLKGNDEGVGLRWMTDKRASFNSSKVAALKMAVNDFVYHGEDKA